ncbi:MAG: RNA polymerase sigma factor [Pirellulaceae bacterium]
MNESDKLLRRCQQRDEMALRELAHCYQDRIFRLAYRVVGDATLAEEATALALVKK